MSVPRGPMCGPCKDSAEELVKGYWEEDSVQRCWGGLGERLLPLTKEIKGLSRPAVEYCQ